MLKMVNLVNFMLSVVYHNKKNGRKSFPYQLHYKQFLEQLKTTVFLQVKASGK